MAEFTNLEEAVNFLHENLHPTNVTSDYPDVTGYLGKSGDVRSLGPLLEALKEGNQYVRATAALGLGYLGKHEAIPHLVEAFASNHGLYVRCDAALALGYLGSEDSLAILLARFQIEEFEVQKRIILAIRKIGTEKARNALITAKSLIAGMEPSPDGNEFLAFLIEEGLAEGANRQVPPSS